MDLIQSLTDDQTAILGSFVALAVCGGIAAIAFRFGPDGRQRAAEQQTLSFEAARKRRQNGSEQTREAA